MPLSIEHAREYTRPLRLEFPGIDGDLNLRYRPLAYSGQDSAAYTQKRRDGQLQEALYEWVVTVIAEWDVLAKGKPVPLTVAALPAVPYGLLQEIQTAIFEDESLVPLRRPAPSRSGLSVVDAAAS